MSWQWINLASSEYDQPPARPTTCGLIYPGRRHVLSGPPESAKTLIAFILALEHLRAGGGPVAHVDFEMYAFETRRLLVDLGATTGELRDVWHAEPTEPPTIDVVDEMHVAGVQLAIIDAAAGAYDASGLDDGKRKDAEAFARQWVAPLFHRGIATIVLDHVVKNADGRAGWAIGSERKIGATDVHLGLAAVKHLTRGGTGLVNVTTHKDRHGWLPRPRAAELELVSDSDTHSITWTWRTPTSQSGDGDHWQPTILMGRICDYLALQPEPVSRNTVEGAIKGKSRDWIRRAMDELLVDGYVGETGGLRGARMLSLLRPFTTSPDLAATSPGEDGLTSPHLAPLLQRGEVRGEDDAGEVTDISRGAVDGTPPDAGAVASPNGRPMIGDDGFLEHLFTAFEAGHVTEGEWHDAERVHRRITAVRT